MQPNSEWSSFFIIVSQEADECPSGFLSCFVEEREALVSLDDWTLDMIHCAKVSLPLRRSLWETVHADGFPARQESQATGMKSKIRSIKSKGLLVQM